MEDCLSISLVIYHPNTTLLQKTLQTLYTAALNAQVTGLISSFFLTIVDNAEHPDADEMLNQLPAYALWVEQGLVVYAPGNIGYGSGHNMAIRARCDAFHLVVNPDVEVKEDALIECLEYLRRFPQVGLVTPRCYRPDGQQEYLCKQYPSLWVLLLRGFAPSFIKRPFQKQLSAYEATNQKDDHHQTVLIASGCFMFFRQQALRDVQGFCEQFFLYFEDFDLSVRLTQHWRIAYVPSANIVHYGGRSAKKGLRHIMMFIRSALLFFRRHGWRFW